MTMRIAGGEFRGRILKTPKAASLRPTQDRVREALFSMIAQEVAGADFLDLFAGTGAVGLEALSRGAGRVTFVESDRRHLGMLRENARTLGVEGRSSVVAADVYRWIAAHSGPGYAIAFADPPYALGEEKGYASVLDTLASRNVVLPDGLFIAEMTAGQRAEDAPGWALVRDRTYGKTRLCVWRRLTTATRSGQA